ncbi:MAG TPA: hypothetical protein VIL86_17625 [Tepidisphaeraceae bacterium]
MSEMAALCSLSRARFYELVRSGVMPPPCYDLHTRRPLYPAEVQSLCLEIKRTNTGFDGRYVLFNQKHQRDGCAGPGPANLKTKSNTTTTATTITPLPDAGPMAELLDGLRVLGINAAEVQVRAATNTCFPSGLDKIQPETALKMIFRHLRRTHAA